MSDIIHASAVDAIIREYFANHGEIFRKYLQSLYDSQNTELTCHFYVFPEKIRENSAIVPVLLGLNGRRVFEEETTTDIAECSEKIKQLPSMANARQISPEVVDVELASGQLKSFYLYVVEAVANELRTLLPKDIAQGVVVGLHDDDNPIVIGK